MAMSVSQLSTMLCEIGDLQAKPKNYGSSVLKYSRRDDPELLAECLRLFMGTVVESAQAPDPSTTSTRDSTAKQSLEIPHETPKSPPVTLSNGQHVLSDIKQQLDCLTEKLSMLQSGNAQLSQSVDETKNKLSTGHSSVQQEMSCLRDKYGILQQDVAVLIAENDKLRQEQAHIKGINDDTIAVRKDLKKTQDDVTFLRQTVKSVQDSLQDSVTKVAELETKMGKMTTPVAFHATLDRCVTTRTAKTLFMRDVITNIGGGYNGQTGMFTAPVSGTYCFMATASPLPGKFSRAEIVSNSTGLAYLWCEDDASCTCHTTVKLLEGQKVSLRSCGEEENKFSGPGNTSFSGMLLQPDL